MATEADVFEKAFITTVIKVQDDFSCFSIKATSWCDTPNGVSCHDKGLMSRSTIVQGFRITVKGAFPLRSRTFSSDVSNCVTGNRYVSDMTFSLKALYGIMCCDAISRDFSMKGVVVKDVFNFNENLTNLFSRYSY